LISYSFMLKYYNIIDFVNVLFPGSNTIHLHEPRFVGNERAYVLDAIDSTFVSSVGPYVNKFEEMMCEITGSKYAVAVVNGTAALHIALKLSGVQPGDLVITQPLSFIATCNAITYCGAEPVFIDVDADRLGMSADALENLLLEVEMINGNAVHIPSGRKISACVPMHTFGFPVEIDRIVDLCSRFDIPVVEDAAESLGSTYKGKHTGTFGLLGTYSFNGNKTVTSGAGGIIVTDDEKLGKMARHITTTAKIPHRWEFTHDQIGYNYRCPNLNAALACAQLEQLSWYLENKRKTALEYKEFFRNSDIKFVTEPDDSVANYWLNAIILPNKTERDRFLNETNDSGIMTRPVWTLLNHLTMYQNAITCDLSNSEWIADRLVNLPSSVRV
jgi:perosamine synthetase